MTVSLKQLRWAHTASGRKALGPKGVKEFEESARGQKLPKYAPSTTKKLRSGEMVKTTKKIGQKRVAVVARRKKGK